MKVTVHLGEPLWRVVQQRSVELELPAGALVADALEALVRRHPNLAGEMEDQEVPWAYFVGDDQAERVSPLSEGATLHLLWALSGG
ncbi:MAG: MoaD/ThiS family protein [Anaerolineales bacterium]